MKIYTAYGERAKTKKYVPGKSRTKQSFKDETNIQFIVDKYQQTGTLEHLKEYEGNYGDFANIDFHEAMNTITRANEMFEDLPSNIRADFENDPGKFLEYAIEPKNHEGMVKLGLAHPKPVEEPLEIILKPEPAKAEEPPTADS